MTLSKSCAQIVCVHIAWLLFMLLGGTLVSTTGESSVTKSWVVLSERYHSKSMAIPVLMVAFDKAKAIHKSESTESSTG